MSLTPEGFERPRLAEIKADYDQRFTDALGPVNTNPDAVVGQIIGIFSAALDDAYETLQANYDSMYPYSAEGTSLDGAVSFVGLERLAATASKVTAVCYGTESTLVPENALVRTSGNVQFAADADTVISRSAACDVEITVSTVTNSANYQIIAGGVSVVYTSGASTTASAIAQGLAALFGADYIASASSDKILLRSADGITDFTLTVDSKLTITKLGTPVGFTCVDKGENVVHVGAVNTIDSQIPGWDSVYNLAAGSTGRNVETDEELRIRHRDGVRASGSATLKAIRARLLSEVDSVTYVSIYENRTSAVVDGMPSHSFEAVVSGGTNQEVANKIWELKPAGIETYGNTSVQVLDDNEDVQFIEFSRSVDKLVWIRVSVNLLNEEEPIPADIVNSIKTAVVNFGESEFNIGEDIITQRFIGPIYSSTTGIGALTVEIALTDTISETPSYSTNNAVIARAELPVFDANRITVVGL